MKNIILAGLLTVLFSSSYGQSDSALKYTEVINVEGVTKDQLFQRARAWFNDAFKSSKDVIQIQDNETGELAGKGIISTVVEVKMMGTREYNATSSFSMKVFTKDGKYKYELSDINNYEIADGKAPGFGVITTSPESPVKWPMYSQKKMNDTWASAKAGVETRAKSLIESLKKAMNTAPSDF